MAEPISFTELIYYITKQIPAGKVATYGQIAYLAHRPRAARAVGTALQHNPYGQGIPCHRVVNRLGELSRPGVFENGYQRRLLREEGISFDRQGRIRLDLCQWDGADYHPPQ